MLNTSMRALVLGSGNTVNVATGRAGGDTITFVNDQNFKEGATIVNLASNLIWTVRGGSGKVWQMYQNIMVQGGGLAAAAFYTSDPGNTRVRNKDVTANYWGKIPQSGKVFTYLAYMDKDGNPDVYVYHDTLFPEKGRHPYNRDRYLGVSRATLIDVTYNLSKPGEGTLIPDVPSRLQSLDTLDPTYQP